jgi:hypothetical protein
LVRAQVVGVGTIEGVSREGLAAKWADEADSASCVNKFGWDVGKREKLGAADYARE